jgi:hypothetical protein
MGYLRKTLSHQRGNQRRGHGEQATGNQQREDQEEELATHALR